MPLTSSFGLDAELQARLRKLGYVFDQSIVPVSREMFQDRFDESLPEGGERTNDLSYGSHERQRLDLCRPAESGRPIVMFVPGGGMTAGNKSMYAHIPAFFARKGFVGVAANYRLAPEFLFPSGARDVAQAVDWLVDNAESHGGDPNNIFLIGQSAGAVHVASTIFDPRARAANHENIKAAILMSGVYKITPDHEGGNINLYFGNDPAELEDRSSCNHVHTSKTPVILTVAELEPAFFGLSVAAMIDALTRRDRHAPEFVWLRGHNHLSPVLNMGNRGDELGDAIVEAIRAYL